jgi:hypothetical protein
LHNYTCTNESTITFKKISQVILPAEVAVVKDSAEENNHYDNQSASVIV